MKFIYQSSELENFQFQLKHKHFTPSRRIQVDKNKLNQVKSLPFDTCNYQAHLLLHQPASNWPALQSEVINLRKRRNITTNRFRTNSNSHSYAAEIKKKKKKKGNLVAVLLAFHHCIATVLTATD